MLERLIERLLFSSRWLLAPIYLGLSLTLLALGIKFFQELFHLLGYLTFVVSALLLGVLDRLAFASHRGHAPASDELAQNEPVKSG